MSQLSVVAIATVTSDTITITTIRTITKPIAVATAATITIATTRAIALEPEFACNPTSLNSPGPAPYKIQALQT